MSENILNVKPNKSKHCCWCSNSKWYWVEHGWKKVSSKAGNSVQESHVAWANSIFDSGSHVKLAGNIACKMFKMAMKQYGSEPPPNLILVLDLLTILPAHHLHGVCIGSQELTIINPSYTALNNENYEFNNWNDCDKLAPAYSWADTKTDTPEEAFVSRTTLVQGIVFVIVLPVFTSKF